ncbi:MAG: GNAT family N-acetyltransferase [Oscillospiraceae bacterium]|nr:GNAT family N-acetyltransferase [Oscillospiraceae bacterium]
MRKAGKEEIDKFREAALKYRASSNFFGGPEKLYGYGLRGDLHIADSGAGIFMLAEAGGFFRLYYAIFDMDAIAPKLCENLPIVAESAYRGAVPPSAAFLARHGFGHALTRSRISLSVRGNAKCTPSQEDTADIGAVLELFEASFDRYTGCLPALPELGEASVEGRIITKMQNGALCGALLYEKSGNVGTLCNIAVAQNMRGRGIGSSILNSWIARSASDGQSLLRLWVADENAPALALYQKHGFKPDGLKSEVMIKTK